MSEWTEGVCEDVILKNGKQLTADEILSNFVCLESEIAELKAELRNQRGFVTAQICKNTEKAAYIKKLRSVLNDSGIAHLGHIQNALNETPKQSLNKIRSNQDE